MTLESLLSGILFPELEGDSVDDEQLRQLEELTKNLQKSVANIKANRGKEN